MRWTWQYMGLLAIVVLIVYGPSMRNDFLYEDQVELQALPDKAVRTDYVKMALELTPEGHWQPLSRALLMAQKGISGTHSPVPYRLLNVLLVALVGMAAYGLMRQAPLGIRRIPAFLAALLLILHPIASASAYRIYEGRDTLLALVFILGSAALYLRGGWGGAVGAALLYALALGSSEQVIWLPIVFAVTEAVGLIAAFGREDEVEVSGPVRLEIVAAKQKRKRGKWVRLIPTLIVLALYLTMRVVLTGHGITREAVAGRMPFYEWAYAWQTLAAPGRVLLHQPALSVWLKGGWLFAGMGLFGLLVAIVILALRHPEATPADRRPVELKRTAFWAAWMLASFPAVAGMFFGGPLFDEGRELAFSLSVWALLAAADSRFWFVEWVRREGVVIGVAAILILAAFSLGRRDYYRDDGTFISQWGRANTEAWRAYAVRAEGWEAEGRLMAAGQQVDRGLMLRPESMELLTLRASIEEKSGRLEGALKAYQEMAAASPTNRALRIRIADLYFKMGSIREAGDLFRSLAESTPENAEINEKLEAVRKAEAAPGS